MVVVPGLNDKEVLEESLSDLWNMGDAVLSAAVVPVGLTQFSHLYTGKKMDCETARSILQQVEAWGERARNERKETWVYGSDELYMLAQRALPAAEHYGEFAQIENGVGAVTSLRMRVAAGLDRVTRLIEGFESPYGMELLASVHWVATHAEEQATDLESVVRAVYGWNERTGKGMAMSFRRSAYHTARRIAASMRSRCE